MVLTPKNYLLFALGVAAIVVGFTLMRMDNEIDGFISLYVAPILIVGGYVEIFFALLWRPKRVEEHPAERAAA
jgi:hypothetical protein